MNKHSRPLAGRIVYADPSLDRIDRSEIERLAAAVDRELDNDRRFFRRHPDRSAYLRKPYPAEHRSAILLGTAKSGPKSQSYVLVHQIAEGRTRIFFTGNPGMETDISEFEALQIHRLLVELCPRHGAFEEKLRQAAATRDGA